MSVRHRVPKRTCEQPCGDRPEPSLLPAVAHLKTCTSLQPARLRIASHRARPRPTVWSIAPEGGARMQITRRRVAGGAALATVASLAAVAAVQASSPSFTPVPNAQTKAVGI